MNNKIALKLTVDSGEALDDDGASSKVSWLQGGVLSARPFSIVLISNHHPVHSIGLDYIDKQRQIKHLKQLSGEEIGKLVAF